MSNPTSRTITIRTSELLLIVAAVVIAVGLVGVTVARAGGGSDSAPVLEPVAPEPVEPLPVTPEPVEPLPVEPAPDDLIRDTNHGPDDLETPERPDHLIEGENGGTPVPAPEPAPEPAPAPTPAPAPKPAPEPVAVVPHVVDMRDSTAIAVLAEVGIVANVIPECSINPCATIEIVCQDELGNAGGEKWMIVRTQEHPAGTKVAHTGGQMDIVTGEFCPFGQAGGGEVIIIEPPEVDPLPEPIIDPCIGLLCPGPMPVPTPGPLPVPCVGLICPSPIIDPLPTPIPAPCVGLICPNPIIDPLPLPTPKPLPIPKPCGVLDPGCLIDSIFD